MIYKWGMDDTETKVIKGEVCLERRQTVLENKNDIYKIFVFTESDICDMKGRRRMWIRKFKEV
jgi:hypothetical protein